MYALLPSYHDVTLGSNRELTVRQDFVNIILVVGMKDVTQYHLTSKHKKASEKHREQPSAYYVGLL